MITSYQIQFGTRSNNDLNETLLIKKRLKKRIKIIIIYSYVEPY